jgi:hypothetical protein
VISAADRLVLLAARRDLVDLLRACIDPQTGRQRTPNRGALLRALRTLPDFKAPTDDDTTSPLPVPAPVRFKPAGAKHDDTAA